MLLLSRFLRKQAHELHDNQVQLRVSGHMQDLPDDVLKELRRVMAETAHYTKGVLTLCLSYGSRLELVDAVKAIATQVKRGELAPKDIDEKTIAAHLYQPDIPDPDFMIRTSGEQRISNFLLWQLSYAEFYFTDVYWPDFREEEFMTALAEYARRHRRFGDIK
jgi:undecaprenyl diphosphate synthase